MSVEVRLKEIEELFLNYRYMVGVSISLYDDKFEILFESNKDEIGFCKLVRENNEIDKRCMDCDEKAFSRVEKSKEMYLYKCHMGLYEAIIPIFDDNRIIGYVMIGQMMSDEPSYILWDNIMDSCRNINIDTISIKSKFDTLKRFTQKEIKSAASIAMACAAYVMLKNIIKIRRSSLFIRIDDFIKANINDEISTDDITSAMNIGRTTLYNCIKENTSSSLMVYIRRLRLIKSKQLLLDTKMKISDISNQVGISDYNYYSRLFKNEYGISPSNFRKENT